MNLVDRGTCETYAPLSNRSNITPSHARLISFDFNKMGDNGARKLVGAYNLPHEEGAAWQSAYSVNDVSVAPYAPPRDIADTPKPRTHLTWVERTWPTLHCRVLMWCNSYNCMEGTRS